MPIARSENNKIYSNKMFLYALFYMVLAVAFIGFTYFIYNRYSIVKETYGLQIKQYEQMREYRKVYVDILNMETGVRGFQLTGDDSFLEPYYYAKQKFDTDIRNAEFLAGADVAETKYVKEWLYEINKLAIIFEDQVDSKRKNPNSDISYNQMLEQKRMMDSLRKTIGEKINEKVSGVKEAGVKSEIKENDFYYGLIIADILFVGLLLAATIFLYKLQGDIKSVQDRAEINEKLYKVVLDGVNDGLFEYDIANGLIKISEAHKKAFGFKDEDLSTDEYLSYIHSDDIVDAKKISEDFMNNPSNIYKNIFRFKNNDGEYRWILSRGFAITDTSGNILKIIGLHTDITEQKNHELELQRLNSELEDFTYVTSHDLRSPLVNLKGFSKELEYTIDDLKEIVVNNIDKFTDSEKNKIDAYLNQDMPESIGFIINSVDRLDNLTKALLDVSRIGRYDYSKIEVNLSDVIKRIIDSYSYEINEKNAKIEVGPLPVIISDPIAIEQIFSNLIDNAVKYLTNERQGKIIISCDEHASNYYFSVKDNGRGIDDNDKDKVFSLFRRARNSLDVRGLGLGMAYVRATVRKLDGHIWFVSKVGEGTNFIFTLPKNSLKQMKEETL